MYQAIINLRSGETFMLDFPSLSSLYAVCRRLNENVYVKGLLVFARDGQHPDFPGSYFGGYSYGGVEALFKEKA